MKLLAASLTLALLAIPAVASASTPASAWADVEEVTFEPNATDVNTATRILIKGVFARSNMDASFPTYAKAQRGYFYYECPSGKLDLCRLEWKDIAAAIGTTNCAGWGDGTKTPGTIRAWCDAKSTVDAYPIHMGVQRTPWASGTCDGLKMFAPAPTCSGTDGGVADSGTTDSGTTVSDTGSTVSDTGTPPVADTGTATTTDTGTASSPSTDTGSADTGSGGTPAAPAGTDDKSGCASHGSSTGPTSMLSPFALIALGLLRASRRQNGAR